MPAACEQERILSVTELTDRMRRTLEGAFPFVWVRGEIGELSFPGSGHIYFTLKDAGAQLQCVWFRDRQMRGRNFDPLTGEIFAEPRPDPVRLLRQGSELFCAGQISVYGPRGRYQLIVELVQAGGRACWPRPSRSANRRWLPAVFLPRSANVRCLPVPAAWRW